MNLCRTLTRKFSFEIDKSRVFRAMDCKEDSHVYQEVDTIYEKLLEIIKKTITPTAVFEFHENVENLDLDILKDTKILIYNFITLGEGITRKTEILFSEGNYLEAFVLDVMTNELLFNMGEEIYKDICTEAKKLGLSLNNRVSPGDEGIPLYYQRLLWEKLKLEELEININEEYVFQPLKSIGFIYTTTDWQEDSYILHQCTTCKNFQCKMRKTDI